MIRSILNPRDCTVIRNSLSRVHLLDNARDDFKVSPNTCWEPAGRAMDSRIRCLGFGIKEAPTLGAKSYDTDRN